MSTTSEVVKKIQRQIQAGINAFDLAIVSTHAKVTQRIFVDGQEGDGNKIGSYESTKPLYVSPSKAPRKFTPKGVDGKSKFKNGKPHKTGYFESYKDFRGKMGRETGFVNLKMTGNLQSDFRSSLTKEGTGFFVAGIGRPENLGKVAGIIDKYGEDVFKLQKDERELLIQTIEDELTGAFK